MVLVHALEFYYWSLCRAKLLARVLQIFHFFCATYCINCFPRCAVHFCPSHRFSGWFSLRWSFFRMFHGFGEQWSSIHFAFFFKIFHFFWTTSINCFAHGEVHFCQPHRFAGCILSASHFQDVSWLWRGMVVDSLCIFFQIFYFFWTTSTDFFAHGEGQQNFDSVTNISNR